MARSWSRSRKSRSTSTIAYTGVVIEKISSRKGEMTDMRPTGAGKTRIVFHGPSRGLIGYHGEFLTDTRGTGVMNRMFLDYAPHKGSVGGRTNGVLISTERRRSGGLWPLVSGRARQAVRRARHQGLSGHDHRPERQGQRSGRQSAQGQAAHQHPHHLQGRSGAADARSCR